jgi:outer membrane protein assembly factor BamB
MKKILLRNIALISAIGVFAFSVMIITNYFQTRGINPLQTEVIETLKELNDEHANNTHLQEQIRQLDLLARRAYFVRFDHLMTGVYILAGMLAVLIISLRLYFANVKQIPAKLIDPVDDWAVKTHARRYISSIAIGLAAAALVFAIFPLAPPSPPKGGDVKNVPIIAASPSLPEEEEDVREAPVIADSSVSPSSPSPVLTTEDISKEEVPKVTHNGFRGNNSNAVSSATGIPVKWDLNTGENIAWTTDIPRKGYNSPVINGNKVFLTGADDEARELYCFDLRTGKRLWTLTASDVPGSPVQMPKTTTDTGLAASTVATNGKQVCAIFASGDLICANMDGKRLWAKNLGIPDNHYGYASSLLVFGNSLIVQYDNNKTPRLLSLDIATGSERWSKIRTDKITWSSPIIAYINKQPQLILMGNPSITAYNPNNGEQYWRVEGLNGEVASSACSAGGLVFGASEYASLIAIDATTGEMLWKAADFLPEVSSPVATKDNVYLATSYGVLACYDAKTGELKHSHELNTEFYSSPMITEGKLYVFSNEGEIYIYSANSEFKLLNSFKTGQKTFATPAFSDGRMVVRTENSLYCVTRKG